MRFQAEELVGQPPFRIARRGLGYVDQSRRIFPDLTVEDNLVVARTGRPGRWSTAEVYRRFPELAPLRHRLGRHLSGGEQRMLAIGRALMGNPLLLLCDEPSEGLGPLVVARLGVLLHDLVQQGLAILLAEQNLRLPLTWLPGATSSTRARCAMKVRLPRCAEKRSSVNIWRSSRGEPMAPPGQVTGL